MGIIKILITGASGFIGRNLSFYLCANNPNDEIIATDIVVNDIYQNVRSNLQFECMDILVPEQIRIVFNKHKPDIVVHLAAIASVSPEINEADIVSTNITGTINILHACVANDVKRFVLASSVAVYGNSYKLPLNITDATSILTSLYGISKLACEHCTKLYSDNYGLQSVILRLSNVYGPTDNSSYGRVVTQFMCKLIYNKSPYIYGDGSQTRDFIYIADVIKAIANVVNNERIADKIFNIASGESISINELFNKIKSITHATANPVYFDARLGDINRISLDIEATIADLGWRPETSLDDGLKQTYNLQLVHADESKRISKLEGL